MPSMGTFVNEAKEGKSKYLRRVKPDEIIIEYDHCTREEGLQLIEETEKKLGDRYCYEVYDHGGKCPHLHIKDVEGLAELGEERIKTYKEAFIDKYAVDERADKSLAGHQWVAKEGAQHVKSLADEFKEKCKHYGKKELVKVMNAGVKNQVEEELVKTLPIFTTRSGDMAHCPWHDDKTPSLEIKSDEGRFYCHACKAYGFIEAYDHVVGGGMCAEVKKSKKTGSTFYGIQKGDHKRYKETKLPQGTQNQSASGDTREIRYSLAEDRFGYVLYADTDERATFEDIVPLVLTIIDPIDGKESKEEVVFLKINGEGHYCRNIKESPRYLEKAKRGRIRLFRRDEEAFADEVSKMRVEEETSTSVLGFWDGKYHDYPYVRNHRMSAETKGALIEEQLIPVLPSKSYIEFIKLKPDGNTVRQLIEKINQSFPRNDQESVFHKLILCWSIGSSLKIALKRCGIALFPILIAIGEKGRGKSTAMDIYISRLWNNKPLSKQFLSGSKGARIKQLDNVVFPVYFDEIEGLDNWKEEMKESATRGKMRLPKGRADGGVSEWEVFSTFSLSSNSFTVNDPAFLDRQIIFRYQQPNKMASDKNLVQWLEKNVVHLGKHIYDQFSKHDWRVWVGDMKDHYAQRGYDQRQADKLITIKAGEKILEGLGILPGVVVPDSLVLNDADIAMTIKDTLREIIFDIMNSCSYRQADELFTVRSVIRQQSLFTSNFANEIERKGIHIRAGFLGVVVSRDAVSEVNRRLALKGIQRQYKGIQEIAEDLEMSFGTHKIIYTEHPFENGEQDKECYRNTTKQGIKFDAEEILDDSKGEETVE